MHAGSPRTWSALAFDDLQARGLRNGGARRAVIEHLGAQSCCRSAQEIFDGIRDRGGRVGIASVYRALDQLVELRLVQRVELGDGVARFEPRTPGQSITIIWSVTAAGRWSRSPIPALEQALEQAASRLAYGMNGPRGRAPRRLRRVPGPPENGL